eukprot:650061-Prorocentrum_minimum.AAC.2
MDAPRREDRVCLDGACECLASERQVETACERTIPAREPSASNSNQGGGAPMSLARKLFFAHQFAGRPRPSIKGGLSQKYRCPGVALILGPDRMKTTEALAFIFKYRCAHSQLSV